MEDRIMQPFVDMNKAEHVRDTAPTVDSIQYEIKGHTVLIELFDYGYPMWGEKFSPKGDDLRERVFLNGKRVDRLSVEDFEYIIKNPLARRASWLPKNITQKLWDQKILEHLDILWHRRNPE